MPNGRGVPGTVLSAQECKRKRDEFTAAFCGRTFFAVRFCDRLWSLMYQRGLPVIELKDGVEAAMQSLGESFVLNQETEEVGRATPEEMVAFFLSEEFGSSDWYVFNEGLQSCLALTHDDIWLSFTLPPRH